MYVRLHVKWPLFFSDFNRCWNASKILVEIPNVKFQENRLVGVALVRVDIRALVIY